MRLEVSRVEPVVVSAYILTTQDIAFSSEIIRGVETSANPSRRGAGRIIQAVARRADRVVLRRYVVALEQTRISYSRRNTTAQILESCVITLSVSLLLLHFVFVYI
jgi:hypothetical protein